MGVDIFFVISGFLITRNIDSLLEKEKFSFLNFYEGRIKRIFPAAAVCIGFILITSSFLLLPIDVYNAASASIASILSYSNFYFAFFVDSGYFSDISALNPLLHFWSLAVEEQVKELLL